MKDQRLATYVEAAHRLSEGRFPVMIPVVGDDQVALLGHALQDLAKAFEKRIEEASLLSAVTQKVNRGVILDEVLAYVFESFRPIIPYDRIGFSLLIDSGKKVQARWARTSAAEARLPIGYTAGLEGSSLQQIIDTGRPRILNDLEEYLSQHPQSESTRLIVAEGMRSSLTCPLVAMGKPIGFMFFSSRERETYRRAHVDTFFQIAGQLSVIVEKSRLYEQILAEQARSERLLLNVIPQSIVERLKETERIIADSFGSVSVLFADIVGFTELASQMSPENLVGLLNSIFTAFDDVAAKWGVEKIKTIGDAYMAAAGLPVASLDHAVQIAEVALDMLQVMKRFSRPNGAPLDLRIGIGSGPVVAGVIGQRKFIYDLWGDTVNVASRMESHGVPGRIQVTEQTRDLLRTRYSFERRGTVEIKGRGEMVTHFLLGRLEA